MRLLKIAAACSLTLLSACASVAPTVTAVPATNTATLAKIFSLSGRFSAKRDQEQVSGQFRYTQHGADRSLQLFSPVGTPLAEIVANAVQATLTRANGATQTAASLSDLLRTVIDLPVTDAMFSAWLQGLPSTASVGAEMVRDASGLSSRFVDGGWEIVVSARMDPPGLPLPKRMRWALQAETDTELRWVIDEWRMP
jgi:outer membrane biogenesis lipoprotein LolB